MAPRSQWNGHLRLSLVSCAVSVYPAISPAERISFRQVNRETGNRLRQQLVDEVTGKVVESHNKSRGYELSDNQFMLIPDEELEAAQRESRSRQFSEPPAGREEQQPAERAAPQRSLKLVQTNDGVNRRRAPEPEPIEPEPPPPPVRPIIENTHTIELDRFVSRSEIDARYLLAPYYIVPRDEVSQEAFAVIREAMDRQELVGMGRIVLANRERPLIVEPMGLGLRGFTLHYAHEVRSETDYFADIPALKLPGDLLDVTEMILNSKREHFDTGFLEDRYRTVLAEKLREKQAQLPTRYNGDTERPSARNVINLMEALKASLATSKPPAPSKTRAPKKDLTAAPKRRAKK